MSSPNGGTSILRECFFGLATVCPRLVYHYSYDALKKYVYQLEKQQVGYRDAVHDLEANESTSLMQGTDDHVSTDALFIPLLDRELKKITLFYEAQEKELLEEVHGLETMVQQQEADGPDIGHQYDRQEDDDDDDEDDDDFNQALLNSEITFSRSPVGRRRRSLSAGNRGSASVPFLFLSQLMLCR